MVDNLFSKNVTCYLVGGAVRDGMLGLPIKDRDYVVVGSNQLELLKLGYEQVGMGFPVFLHPETREEYALARKEKKIGAGYTGFEFQVDEHVTLEEDLARRDLTINSMAMTPDGALIDPFGGLDDLYKKVLRHTSAAFGEDPLRVVRLARFYARYTEFGFIIAPETLALATRMVRAGELNELPNERFWLELEKAFSDSNPAVFIEALDEMTALSHVHFFMELFGTDPSPAVSIFAEGVMQLPVELRVDFWAALVAPANAQSALRTARAINLHQALQLVYSISTEVTAEEVFVLLTRIKAFSMGHTADDLVLAVGVFESSLGSMAISRDELAAVITVARTVTAEKYHGLIGKAIGAAMADERIALIETVLTKHDNP